MAEIDIALYKKLLTVVTQLGPFEEEVKKTSIHLVRKSAFLGVHPRKNALLLTVKSARPIEGPRIVKSEQVSKNRWHIEVKVAAPGELDSELLGWIREAYELCA